MKKPLEIGYAPSTQISLPEGAKARIGKGTIRGIEYTSDGTQFAVMSSIGIWLYDAETLQELALLTEHTEYIYSGCLSPDGTKAASGAHNGSVRIWDAITGKLLETLEGPYFKGYHHQLLPRWHDTRNWRY